MYRLIPSSRFIFGYILGFITFSITTIILYLLRDVLDTPLIALLFLLPVGINTAFWGLGPGILTALSAFLGFNYFFIQPYYTLVVHQSSDLLVLTVFLIVAVVISQLVARAQAGLAAATAREREATKLYELSASLAGVQDDQAILRIVAVEAMQTFQAERVEVSAAPNAAAKKLQLFLPVDAAPLTRKPEWTVPLQTARGVFGEIRLWRIDTMLEPIEERLLHTFASQGAMALERVLA